MEDQSQNSVTFRMRIGKQIEQAFGALWCVGLSSFGWWLLFMYKGEWGITYSLFFLLFIGVPLLGTFVFIMNIVRSRLTFSADGIYFQGPFSSRKALWEEVKGFYSREFEIYLFIEKSDAKKKSRKDIPLSWFAKMRSDNKSCKGDKVLNSLINFAPHLFNSKSLEKNYPGLE